MAEQLRIHLNSSTTSNSSATSPPPTSLDKGAEESAAKVSVESRRRKKRQAAPNLQFIHFNPFKGKHQTSLLHLLHSKLQLLVVHHHQEPLSMEPTLPTTVLRQQGHPLSPQQRTQMSPQLSPQSPPPSPPCSCWWTRRATCLRCWRRRTSKSWRRRTRRQAAAQVSTQAALDQVKSQNS